MNNDDPMLRMAEKLGELSGVILTFQRTVSCQLDDIKSDMKDKIDINTSRSIAKEEVERHEEHLHKNVSVAPGVSLRIDKAILLKLIPYIVGVGGAGVGAWTLIEKLIH